MSRWINMIKNGYSDDWDYACWEIVKAHPGDDRPLRQLPAWAVEKLAFLYLTCDEIPDRPEPRAVYNEVVALGGLVDDDMMEFAWYRDLMASQAA